MTTSSLHIVIAGQRDDALSTALAAFPAPRLTGKTTLLPSSLDANDPVARQAAGNLRAQGAEAVIVPPPGMRTRLTSFLRAPAQHAAWTRIPLTRRDTALQQVTLPAQLAGAPSRIMVCDLDRVAARGPFILDLLAHYTHPRDRLRLLASGQRSQSVAEVNLALTPSPALIAVTYGGASLVAITGDPVAAELLALALAELKVGRDVSYTGPWEDEVVQRATELDLGVHYPGEIGLVWEVAPDLVSPTRALREHIVLRLGLPLAT
ncbi:MAG: hypothetical protein WBA63_11765 [Thermomicrobiales bacterium]